MGKRSDARLRKYHQEGQWPSSEPSLGSKKSETEREQTNKTTTTTITYLHQTEGKLSKDMFPSGDGYLLSSSLNLQRKLCSRNFLKLISLLYYFQNFRSPHCERKQDSFLSR